MNDIQRWYIQNPPGQPTEFVSYEDHIAVLRACEKRVFQEQIKGRQHDIVMAYLRGLDAAREAVEKLAKDTWCDSAPCWGAERFLAAIDALKEKP